MNNSKTFLLIHGAWEGAWSWKHTTTYLEQMGHKVAAIDLPGHGDNKTPVADITLKAYADRVLTELNTFDKPVILVGHSFAGFINSVVADQAPEKIEKLIFIASALPYEGKTAMQVFEEDEGSEFLENLILSDDKTTATMTRETIKEVIFTGATEAQLDFVIPQLVEQATKPFFEPVVTSEENFGRVPKAYVETTMDKVISLKMQRHCQKKNGITEAITLEYGHVPLETAPAELAQALNQLATSND